jgi:hypothetical protein
MANSSTTIPLHMANFIAQRPLSPRNCLVPLFEAITNSMDAIKDARLKNGLIRIHIHRQPVKAVSNDPGLVAGQPIFGFTVEDNGIGFTQANYDCFNLAGTPNKVSKGGKGMGRLTWLKTFDHAEIESCFAEAGKHYRRKFVFGLTTGVKPISKNEVSDREKVTTVKLVNYLPEYRKACPKNFSTLARKIIRQFLSSFILDTCPHIVLVDSFESKEVDLKDYFNTEMKVHTKETSFKIDGQTFCVQHLCLAGGQESTHELHFCARNSSVTSQVASDLLPILRAPLHDGNDKGKGRAFYYTGCVTGELFDQRVMDDRTNFDIPFEKNLLQGEKEVTWEKIYDKLTHECDKFLTPFLRPHRDDNNKRIERFIKEREPRYRPLIKHKSDWFDRISPTVPDDNLGFELFKLWTEYEIELKQKQKRTKKQLMKTSASIEDKKKALHEFMQEFNDAAMFTLADYVVHRRAVLDLLAESVKVLDQESEKYATEDQIHTIICPMKVTSEDVSPDQMNLWVIDERMAFHHYLASDKPHQTVAAVTMDGQDRSDLLIFTHPVAFSDDAFNGIIIVEFKRPMRKDYTEKENPISQIYSYIAKLRSGTAEDKNGRPIPVKPTTPILGYIVADPTPNLKKWLVEKDFHELPDDGGWSNYHKQYGAYVEVMTFRKLLLDAEKRNLAFFNRLGLPLPQGPIM